MTGIVSRITAAPLRWATGLLMLAMAAQLLRELSHYGYIAAEAVHFPFQLDYGEGIVWQQMRLIMAGKGYGAIDGFPAIVFHYPPLYHVLVAWLAGWGGADELAAGRLVSVISAIVTSVLIALILPMITPRLAPRRLIWLAGFLAALVFLSMEPVEFWSVRMRVDMVCIALSLGGLYCGIRAVTQPRAICLAAVLFVAAIYTKQTALAAPAAVFATLLFLRPRTALAGIACTVGLGLVVLAGLSVTSDGGFLQHIVLYNVNRFDWRPLLNIVRFVARHFAFVCFALFAALRHVKRLRAAYRGLGRDGVRRAMLVNPHDAGLVMVLIHALGATLMLGMLAKSGASDNYLIELSCLIALLAGLTLLDVLRSVLAPLGQVRPDLLTLGIPAAVLFQLTQPDRPQLWDEHEQRVFAAQSAQLAGIIKAAPRPVISDDMVVILRGGKAVQWEPAIFAELASKGVWDERPFLARIRGGAYAFFITRGVPGEMLYNARYTPAVSAAIHKYYPLEAELAGYRLHFPAGPFPAFATDLHKVSP